MTNASTPLLERVESLPGEERLFGLAAVEESGLSHRQISDSERVALDSLRGLLAPKASEGRTRTLMQRLSDEVSSGQMPEALQQVIRETIASLSDPRHLSITALILDAVVNLKEVAVSTNQPREEQYDLYLAILALSKNVRDEVPAWNVLANELRPVLAQRFGYRSDKMLQGIVD